MWSAVGPSLLHLSPVPAADGSACSGVQLPTLDKFLVPLGEPALPSRTSWAWLLEFTGVCIINVKGGLRAARVKGCAALE